MRRAILLLVAALFFLFGGAGQAVAVEDGWANINFTKRALVTIDSSMIAGSADSTLTNFMVNLQFTSAETAIFSNTVSDGRDLLFTGDDGTTVYPHELVSWDTSGETGEVWIQWPILSETNNTCYVYFDYAAAPALGEFAGQQAWGPKWHVVYHFEDWLGDQSTIDATGTAWAYHMGNTDSFTAFVDSVDRVTGKIGKGITLASDKGLRTWGVSFIDKSFTVGAWLKHTDTSTGFLIHTGPGYWHLSAEVSNAHFQFEQGYDYPSDWRSWNYTEQNVWNMVTAVYDRSDTTMTAYKDSAAVSWDTQDGTLDPDLDVRYGPTWGEPTGILGAMKPQENIKSDNFDGIADEFFIYLGAMSPNRIATRYYMTNDNAAWFSVGTAATKAATVSVDSISGTFAEGDTMTITGANMGAYTLDIEFIGDDIDAASPGTNVRDLDEPGDVPQGGSTAGWTTGLSVAGSTRPEITEERYWSAPHSIDGSFNAARYPDNARGFSYNKGAEFEEVYATWYEYQDIIIRDGDPCMQWKMHGFNICYQCSGDVEGSWSGCNGTHMTSFYTSTNPTDPNTPWLPDRGFLAIAGCSGGCQSLVPPFQSKEWDWQMVVPNPVWRTNYPPPATPRYSYEQLQRAPGLDVGDVVAREGVWARWEFWFKESSSIDQPDGAFLIAHTDQDSTRVVTADFTGARTWASLCDRCCDPDNPQTPDCAGGCNYNRKRQFSIYNEFTNCIGAVTAEKFYDDVYIQFGNRVRVEVGNAATWAACTQREVQIAQTWTNAAITFEVNLGKWGNDTFPGSRSLYAYVIGPDGQPLDTSGLVVTQTEGGRGSSKWQVDNQVGQ